MNADEPQADSTGTAGSCAGDSAGPPAADADSRRSCWMVVDNDAGILKFLAPSLRLIAGVETCCFTSPTKALQAYTEAPDRFQCVVTDLDMPGMGGIEFCRKLRLVSPDLKVLLITGTGLLTAPEAQTYGFCGLLTKPFTLKTLEKTLKHAGMPDTASRLL